MSLSGVLGPPPFEEFADKLSEGAKKMRLGPGMNQDTELGPLASAEHLAASVWTSDLRTAHTLAAQINASNVFVNHAPVLDPAAPWGGFKASEYGQEMGRYAIDSYTQLKSVWVNLAG